MIYHFILISDEVNNFRRDIVINSDATFFQLHEAILNSVNYTKDQLTSFFICSNNWSRKIEITIINMESPSYGDIYVMNSCKLSELLDEKKQKLIYVFDQLNDRCFFIELYEIFPEKNQDKPKIVKFSGIPPKQTIKIENVKFSDFFLSDSDENDHFYQEIQDNEFSFESENDD